MNGLSYVYILEGLSAAGGYYVGLTDDFANRLAKHHEGGVPYTARLRPWRVKTAIAFRDHVKAAAFEKYLKSLLAALSRRSGFEAFALSSYTG